MQIRTILLPTDFSDCGNYALSYAASLAFYLINEGIEVKFIADEWQSNSLESILEYLALVEISGVAAVPATIDGAFNLSLRA